MSPRDFEDDYPQTSERSPGVYTRAENRSPNELDMLWSGSKFHKEERSPFIFFVAGFILAAILTSAVFLVLNNRPKAEEEAAKSPEYLQTPVENPLVGEESKDAEQLETTSSTAKTPGEATKSQPTRTVTPRTAYKTYVVKSGDSLGSIAIKVYGSSGPEYVDKLQRANNLSSPDKLQLDQKLIVPPMN